ncbi:MAG: cyclic nucleotide-binding domain-containing protein [Myxococcota bacterium]
MAEPVIEGLGMDAFERFLFLRTVPMLRDLPADVIRVIAAHTNQQTFEDGAHVYRAGESAGCVHFVVDGEIALGGHEGVIRLLGPRDIVGDISAMTGDTQAHDGVARGTTTTLEIMSGDMQEVLEDHFVLLRRIVENTARRVLQALRQLGPQAGFDQPEPQGPYPKRPLDLVEKMAFFRESSALYETHIEAISDLSLEVEEVRWPAGTELWEVGHAATHFLLIVHGAVRCDAESPEQHFVLGPSDSAGANEALAGERRWFRARVDKDLVALKVDVDVLYDVLEDHFQMAMSMLRQITIAIARLDELKAKTAHARRLESPAR